MAASTPTMPTGITPDTAKADAGSATDSSGGFNQAIADLKESFEIAQKNSALLRKVGIEEGSILAADKKQATPV